MRMRTKKVREKEKQADKPLVKHKNCLAKINLFLDILKKRDDDFHELNSLFAELSLSDKILIKLTENSQIKISCTSDTIPDKSNLVFKIASYLKDKYKVKSGIEIYLKKNIPVAAGLGGGSSDAAKTIQICNEIWNLGLSPKQMHKLAAKFGSDINFFLEGGVKLVKGRGEIVLEQKNNLEIANILLVNPHIQISSKKAYNSVQSLEPHTAKFKNMQKALRQNELDLLCKNLHNSLEPGIFSEYPEIQSIKKNLLKLGASGSLMSGSGSTVFAIFKKSDTLLRAEHFFAKKNFWTHKTSLKKVR